MNQRNHELHDILLNHFDEGELRTLCFFLKVDYDDLPDEGKSNRARELIRYLQRRGRVDELEEAIKEQRPTLFEDTNSNESQFRSPVILAQSIAARLKASPELATELTNLISGDEPAQVILVEQGSRVKDINQKLGKVGKQETMIRGSQTGNITQEQ